MNDKDFDRVVKRIENACHVNPTDMKERVSYLEAGIKEVRARLTLLRDWESSARYARFYWDGVKDGAAFAIRLLDEILPASDEEMGVPILTRDGKEDEK